MHFQFQIFNQIVVKGGTFDNNNSGFNFSVIRNIVKCNIFHWYIKDISKILNISSNCCQGWDI